MIKKWSFYTTLTIIIAFLSSGFKASDSDSDSKEWFIINEDEAQGNSSLATRKLLLSKNHKASTKKLILLDTWENTSLVGRL